jgi:hypothetical protein
MVTFFLAEIAEPQRGGLSQPRPTAWVNRGPILTMSPVRAKYEVRIREYGGQAGVHLCPVLNA